ncbi:hypothetical protein [Nostoc sp. FACHB-110]|uniref:hypothetical protein n=1 Tax=Nostoc sp. FACHB-110 TaxID=2692834 RepID=UPI001683F6E5|nr:hypothetical protein [Nostoc sp. FACHB-110]MBD2440566.1 hypothetical protein [Nostoc sp. FACHB-110]
MQAWVEAAKKRSLLMNKFKSDLFWIGNWISTGNKAIILYLLGIGIYTTLGFLWGINAPTSIACPKMQSSCYFWRWNKNQVVLPEQAKQLIEEYEKNKVKTKIKPSRRQQRK